MKLKQHKSVPLAFALSGAFCLAVPSLHAGSAKLLNHDKMLIVDGQPRFILGLYENPKDDAMLTEAVDAGFNLIQCSADVEALNRVQRARARAWVNLGGSLDLSSDTANRKQHLAETIRQVGQHPALLVWEGPDEILWNNWWVTMERLRPELLLLRN